MTPPKPSDFPAFYEAVHGYRPFSWQRRLAERAAGGDWPEVLDLPTASGKTACVDIAVFALACQADLAASQRSAPRRIAFVVDRRIIVSAAYRRALLIADRLQTARDWQGTPSEILAAVAASLRQIGGLKATEAPLVAYELRGGIYRDPSWARSIVRPMVIASTVDQIGSRLLFRGYGVSNSSWPIHAALAGNDTRILLDEAHCALPFLQTVQAVSKYRRLTGPDADDLPPFGVTVLSATPPRDLLLSGNDAPAAAFGLDSEDRLPNQLGPRLEAAKSAVLVEPVVASKLADALAERARKLADGDTPRAVVIFVNRVETARQVHARLTQGRGNESADVVLMIGRMRPIDRDALVDQWFNRLRSGADRKLISRNIYVIATQCLEVGADFDFDVLISECASLDALRQRFGRLNRLGRPIITRAAILARVDQVKEGAKPDPVYGESLGRTWRWLRDRSLDQGDGPAINFGIDALNRLLAEYSETLDQLRVEPLNAPVLLPAHLDCWGQTAPCPTPDPDPALFLRGPGQNRPEVRICWRADLTVKQATESGQRSIDTVALCPPVAAECMSVPYLLARNWLDGRALPDVGSDLEDSDIEDLVPTKRGQIPPALTPLTVVRWAGPDDERTMILVGGSDLSPGDTLVVSAEIQGWDRLGYIPNLDASATDSEGDAVANPFSCDVAERCYLKAGRAPLLRLHRNLMQHWPAGEACSELIRIVFQSEDPGEEEAELRAALLDLAAVGECPEWLARTARGLGSEPSGRLRIVPYDDGFEEPPPKSESLNRRTGIVLYGSTPLSSEPELATLVSEDDTALVAALPVPLDQHSRAVEAEVRRSSELLGLSSPIQTALTTAARWHDLGKADRRFQALLQGGNLARADQAPRLLAKSATASRSRERRERDRRRSGFPAGGRHELLSVRLAEANDPGLDPAVDLDLVLHLIASHHGRARPLLPFAADLEPGHFPAAPDHRRQLASLIRSDGHPPAAFNTSFEESQRPPLHRLDGGPAQRFWLLVRRYGWWGLAWLEAVLRLADQVVSQSEQYPERKGKSS